MKKNALMFCSLLSIAPIWGMNENQKNENLRDHFYASIASRAQEPTIDPEIKQLIQEAAQTNGIRATIKVLQARVNFVEQFLLIDNPNNSINRHAMSELKEKALGVARKKLEEKLSKSDLTDTQKAHYTAQIVDYLDTICEQQILEVILQETSSHLQKIGTPSKQEEKANQDEEQL